MNWNMGLGVPVSLFLFGYLFNSVESFLNPKNWMVYGLFCSLFAFSVLPFFKTVIYRVSAELLEVMPQ